MARPDLVRCRVNGATREVPAGSTLASLVDTLGLDHRFLVVELNGEPAAFARVASRSIQDGDNVELVRPVAGG